MSSFNLYYLKVVFPNMATLGVRASTSESEMGEGKEAHNPVLNNSNANNTT